MLKNLILIHGALGNKKELFPIGDFLKNEYIIHYFEIPGHGERFKENDKFNLKETTKDFHQFVKNIGESYVFGFSLGGYLALNCLLEFKTTEIKGVVTLGTKLNWSPLIAEEEIKGLDAEKIAAFAPVLYKHLENIHGAKLNQVILNTRQFLKDLGNSPTLNSSSVKSIQQAVRIVRGQKDRLVSREESQTIANQIKNCFYFEIPSFSHPIGFLNPKMVAKVIANQLASMEYQFITTHQGRMAYKVIGEIANDKPILLFLHESLGSIAQWKKFPEELCCELGLSGIILEHIGYGFSDSLPQKRDEQYLHNYAFKNIPAFLTALKIDHPLILIGHSDGGTEALLYSKKYPEKVKGVITIAAHVLNESETRAGIPPVIKAYEEGKLKALEVYHGEKTEDVFYAWADTWLADFFKNWTITKEIKGIEASGLIIQGENDEYGTIHQVEQIENAFCSTVERFVVPKGNHSPHLLQSKLIIEKIKKWSKKLS